MLTLKPCLTRNTEQDEEGVERLDLFDVEAVEAAESSTDQFIERRARQNDEVNRIEAQWKASTRRHNEQREQRRRENCSLWYLHHCYLHAVHQGLANRHRERTEALLEPGEAPEAVQSQRGNTTP